MNVFFIGITSMCIVFSLLTIFLYFYKGRIKTIETRIYSFLLTTNLIALVLEMLSHYGIANAEKSESIKNIFLMGNKLYIATILIWFFIFNIYVFLVTSKLKNESEEYHKYHVIVRLINVILMIATGLVILFSPLEIIYKSATSAYTNGIGINFVLIPFGFTCFSIWLVKCILNYKKLKEKQYLPILICIVLMIVIAIVQSFDRSYLIIVTCQTIVTILMFHTIENPDLKMLGAMELAKDEAERANNAKSDFITNMSHEIRTPLNAIVAFSEEIENAEALQDAKNDAKEVKKAGKVLLETIGGILDMSKIESGKMEITSDIYSTKELFDTVTSLINVRMKEKNLDLIVKIAPDVPSKLFGDRPHIQQVLMNLMTNAYKYTNTGSVTFKVDCIRKSGICKLVMSVQDTGRGIKTENIDKLFTKFNRLDEDKNTTTEGTGLGLAITKKLVEMMEGTITVHSVYGEGSLFTVTLDQVIKSETSIETSGLNQEASTRQNVATPENIASTPSTTETNDEETINYTDYSGFSILATDDNNINLKVATRLVKPYNINISTSLNSSDTMSKINNGEKFDLLLMDIEIPSPSKKGPEIMKDLKAMGYRVPIIAWTANATSGDREKYLKDGFDDYLSKPTSRVEFDRLLHKYFDNKASSNTTVPKEHIEDKKQIDWSNVPTVTFDSTGETNANVIKDDKTTTNNLIKPNFSSVLNTPEVIVQEKVEVGEEKTQPQLSQPTSSNKGNIDYLKSFGADIDKALETLGDIEMFNDTMKDFLESVPEKLSKIHEYKNAGDMNNYAIYVHGLKSDLKYIGFYNVAEIHLKHEMAGKENNVEFVNSNFNQLVKVTERVVEICKEYLGK